MQERKIAAWVEAGVIDTAVAARIREFEAAHARPLALWAVIGIAALAIGLGVILTVAANWDAIPPQLRLAVHFVLLTFAAAGLWLRGPLLAARKPWLHEAALFVFGMLGLAFFGHVGQVYQTSAPLWQPLLGWLILFGPLFLIRGLSWPSATLLVVVAALTGWNFSEGFLDTGWWRQLHTPNPFAVGLATGAPLLFAAPAAWARSRSNRPAFWRRLEQLGFGYAIGGASLIAMTAGMGPLGGDHVFFALSAQALLALVAGAAVWLGRPGESGRATAALFAAAAVVALIAFPFSGMALHGGLLFMALWSAVAAASLFAGWRGVFQLAVAVIALRLIVLAFELDDDLLTSGLGLIASGVLILGVSLAAVRITRRFAPAKEAAT